MREYDATRNIYHSPTPSRYKLEAIRIAKESSGSSSSMSTAPTTSISSHVDIIGSGLLDTYEIESISKKLDGLMESSSGTKHVSAAVDNNNDNDDKKREKKKKKLMMMRGLSHAVVCGTREDAVESIVVVAARRRPENRVVPVVRMANCRPRATHAR